MRYGELKTDASIARTRRDIGDTMRKWGVQVWDLNTGRTDASVKYTIRGKLQFLECKRFSTSEQNARAIYGLLDALRLADQRGMLRELAEQATALLEAPARKKPAHEVLGVFPDALIEVAEAAYKALARMRHPDVGGSEEAMTELNRAIEEFRRERAA